ncbi:MAG TPA: protein translocase subunit SecDF [Candidatus Omnitrophica bacterium]|nr:protein translocase subunit SecDF [Candidatus Omnitrophota bacterium]
MHLVLRVDMSKLSADAKNDAVERAIEIVRNRIDEFGVSEPLIQRQGTDQIVVQLPGVTDRERAKDLIGKTALLEFKLVNDKPQDLTDAAAGKVPDGFDYVKDEEGRAVLLSKTASLTGQAVKDASVGIDQYGLPAVKLTFNEKGIDAFAKLTGEHINERLAIVLDGKIHSAPAIRSKIDSGEAEITRGGGFGVEEANDLRIVLRSGALPAPMNIEEERTLGPLLGADSIRTGVKASIIGTLAVFVFMIIYYLFSGVVACIALSLNFLFILACMGYFHATLTLPGIAGIVLTLGMAVDANVLISERIREELKLGKSLFAGIQTGYAKALSAIFDSNFTTLIAAFFLFQFGTGPIRGFALTLTIGLLASMFTAIFVTKAIFELTLTNKNFKSLKMLQFIGETKFDFIAKRKIFYALSSLVIIIGLVSFFKKGKDAYGIDFSGGQLQEYSFTKPVAVDTMRAILKEAGISDGSIQQFKEDPKIVMIRTSVDTADAVAAQLKKNLADNPFEVLRVENVGPVAGKELQKKALMALGLSLLGILFYVAYRFKHFNFAIAGVIALFHDVLVTLGILALTGKQIDLLIVTALLTIAGYSINDTIVIYDRVRENMRAQRKLTLAQIINLSVNQTLSRSILTSGVTLLAVSALFFWGGAILHNFAFSLLVGFISGVYSTVFIASPLVLAWSKNKK